MDTGNPYAPPRAGVADVVDAGAARQYQPVQVFSAKGRIGRLRLMAYCTSALFVVRIIEGALFAALAGYGGIRASGILPLFWMALAVYVFFFIIWMIQRAHDMDWSGWSVLLAFIPLAGLIFLFKPGSEGGNRYGLPPPPNGLGVKILGSLFPVMMALGIAAAIAIPAYVSHKARSAAGAAR